MRELVSICSVLKWAKLHLLWNVLLSCRSSLHEFPSEGVPSFGSFLSFDLSKCEFLVSSPPFIEIYIDYL